ncbi:MAG: FxsA family protein [Myxococcota bacterium]
MWWLFPLIALPFVELWTLLELGSAVGVGLTLAWCLVAGALGVALMRRARTRIAAHMQGGTSLGRMRSGDASVPRAFLEDGLLLASGAFFAFPGLVSDVLGLVLLLPFVRRAVVSLMARPRTRAARPAPTGGPSPVAADVEIYPPGTLRAPGKRRPVIIDVD